MPPPVSIRDNKDKYYFNKKGEFRLIFFKASFLNSTSSSDFFISSVVAPKKRFLEFFLHQQNKWGFSS
jgi:hypothetical protein